MMGTSPISIKLVISFFFFSFLFHFSLTTPSSATTTKLFPSSFSSSSFMSQPQPTTLNYHNGPILTATNLSLSIVWYGLFKPSHKSILLDFLSSLKPAKTSPSPLWSPSASSWWESLESYTSLIIPQTAGKVPTFIDIHKQTTLDSYPLGRVITRSQLSSLAVKAAGKHEDKGDGVIIIFTDRTVAVEGFCMSSCARHGSISPGRVVYIWVGDPVDQCPGQCAWPFHRPVYGPQTPPLVAPNGDVGADGMVIGLATALAGAVTNPYGSGFFQGAAEAPLEAATACAGAYGSGWYPGYTGEVLVDEVTGGSYNAYGLNGRKFLVPGLWDPVTRGCKTLV